MLQEVGRSRTTEPVHTFTLSYRRSTESWQDAQLDRLVQSVQHAGSRPGFGGRAHTAAMVQISSRLLHRIRLVLDRLSSLDDLVRDSRQDPQRMLAAVVRVALGRLDRLDQAMALARRDWRDLLVAADLAHEDWPARLSAWLDTQQAPAVDSPGTRGEFVDADGLRWRVRRRFLPDHLPSRSVQLMESALAVVVGVAMPPSAAGSALYTDI